MVLDFSAGDIEKLATGLGLLVPGALVLFVRSQFLTGRRRTHTEEAFSYVIASLFYFAAFLPLYVAAVDSSPSSVLSWLAWIGFLLVGPIAVGILAGLAAQKQWLEKLAATIGLKVVHPVPTAWDWKFGQRDEQWLIVKLTDETKFYCYYGGGSFASSDGERDLYVEQIYDFDGNGNWTPLVQGQGLWVPASQVSTIEFLPVRR